MNTIPRTIRLFFAFTAWTIVGRSGTPTIAAPQSESTDGIWRALDGALPPDSGAIEPVLRPDVFRAFVVDMGALAATFEVAPREFSEEARRDSVVLSVPLPDGTFGRFQIVDSPVMSPVLAAKFPEITTYYGRGIDDPMATGRFDWTPAGFHAQILSPNGTVYVDPYQQGNPTVHMSFYKRDMILPAGTFSCLVPGDAEPPEIAPAGRALVSSGEELRTYRLACAATREYTQFHGGSVVDGLAAVVTAINRVTGVYETEVAVRMELVDNNDLVVFTEEPDPYSNFNGSIMIGENISTLNGIIGFANYDIGHVFSTGGGGIAGLGVVCRSGGSFSHKASGVTGLSSPVGDAFYVDFVAHEMGHQFGATHTFNGVLGNCSGNRTGSTAYEPGSGSTIMAYAGICSLDDLQPHSDPYFHSASLDQIIAFTVAGTGNSCASISATGNMPPLVDAGADFTIPQETPFQLSASGSDPDGQSLSFCWEERDLGPANRVTDPDNGTSPLFRSFLPLPNGTRTFPRMSDILGGGTTKGEQLPTTSRFLDFRVTARDSDPGGGGLATDEVRITVDGASGPFAVTFPNTAISWRPSDPLTVTWNVAGTDGPPVDTATVNLLLSTDDGNRFTTTLAAGTPNDGAETVLLPNVGTTAARIRVEAIGNVFFDISDDGFTIIPELAPPAVAAYPHDRVKNRFISFDPIKAAHDGLSVAFKITLTSLTLGSCEGNGGFCREDRGASDCKVCSVDGNPCVSGPIDCAPSPVQSCEPTGATCINDAPDVGGTSVGGVWWVGPAHPLNAAVHLMVSEPFRKVSANWSNPVHVGDCEIVPQARYAVRAVDANTSEETEAVEIATTLFAPISSSYWGDCVGPLKKFCGGDIRTPECLGDDDCVAPETCDFAWTLPDGSVNVDDIGAVLALVAPGPLSVLPDLTWVDLHGDGSGTTGSQNFDPPNLVANVSDIGQVIFGFQGRPYTFFDPADCPDATGWP